MNLIILLWFQCTAMKASASRSFYKNNALYKHAGKNVVYLAYVGKYKDPETKKCLETYKYGISSDVFKREYMQHQKQFEHFEMCWIKNTYNNLRAEELFERELKIRDIHRSMVINRKRQTELFIITPDYSFDYLKNLFNKITKTADKDILDEINQLKKTIKEKDREIQALKLSMK